MVLSGTNSPPAEVLSRTNSPPAEVLSGTNSPPAEVLSGTNSPPAEVSTQYSDFFYFIQELAGNGVCVCMCRTDTTACHGTVFRQPHGNEKCCHYRINFQR